MRVFVGLHRRVRASGELLLASGVAHCIKSDVRSHTVQYSTVHTVTKSGLKCADSSESYYVRVYYTVLYRTSTVLPVRGDSVVKATDGRIRWEKLTMKRVTPTTRDCAYCTHTWRILYVPVARCSNLIIEVFANI